MMANPVRYGRRHPSDGLRGRNGCYAIVLRPWRNATATVVTYVTARLLRVGGLPPHTGRNVTVLSLGGQLLRLAGLRSEWKFKRSIRFTTEKPSRVNPVVLRTCAWPGVILCPRPTRAEPACALALPTALGPRQFGGLAGGLTACLSIGT